MHRYEVELVIDVREVGTDGGGQRARFSKPNRIRARAECPAFDWPATCCTRRRLPRPRPLRRPRHALPRVCRRGKGAVKRRQGPARRPRRVDGGVAARTQARGADRRAGGNADPDAMARPAGRARDDPLARRARDVVLDVAPGRSIGYVTDLRYSESNVAALSRLLAGVDLLFIESVFLDEDLEHASRKNHLTARRRARSPAGSAPGRSCPSTSRRVTRIAPRSWLPRCAPRGPQRDTPRHLPTGGPIHRLAWPGPGSPLWRPRYRPDTLHAFHSMYAAST